MPLGAGGATQMERVLSAFQSGQVSPGELLQASRIYGAVPGAASNYGTGFVMPQITSAADMSLNGQIASPQFMSGLRGVGSGAVAPSELAQLGRVYPAIANPAAVAQTAATPGAQLAAQATGSPWPASAVQAAQGLGATPTNPTTWGGYGKGMFGRLGNIMRTTPFSEAPILEQAPGMFARGGALGFGWVGLGAGLGIAGYGAGTILHKAWNDPNSQWDDAASGALKGAGTGAGIGSFAGPWGAAAGGLIGGLAGGAMGYFGSADEGDKAAKNELGAQTKKLTELMTQFGASDDLKQQALLQLQLLANNAGGKDDVRKAADMVNQMIIQAIPGDQAHKKQATRVAAMQSWMKPMLQDSLNKSQFYNDAYSNAAMGAAGGVTDPNLRASLEAMAKGTSASAASQNAYAMQQLMATPALYGYNTGTDQSTGLANTDLNSILSAQPVS